MRETVKVDERDEIVEGSLSHRALVAMFMRGDEVRNRPALSEEDALNFAWAQEQLAREDAAELKARIARDKMRRAIERGIGDA